MAKSKNSDFEDVCIPLHKAQLLENVPYFKAMFANNWRENKGCGSRSYGVSVFSGVDKDVMEKTEEFDDKIVAGNDGNESDDVYDQPSTSKNPANRKQLNKVSPDKICTARLNEYFLEALFLKARTNRFCLIIFENVLDFANSLHAPIKI